MQGKGEKQTEDACWGILRCLLREVLFYAAGNLLRQGLHFVLLHLDMMMEVEVGFGLHGYQMDVGVGHFETQHGDTHFDTGTGLFEAAGHAVGKALKVAIEVLVEVEDVVDLLLGNAEDMAFDYGIDVEKGKAVVGFGNFVAGDFAGYDA